MKTTLITGGIGSGKSAIRRYLESKGYPVYDCDSRCKALYDEIPGFRECLERELALPFDRWNEIFRDEALRLKLESLVLPALMEDLLGWKEAQCAQRCFVESATALDKPLLRGLWDEVWLVTSDWNLRLGRNPKVAERAAIQHYDSSKADVVITNNGTLDELYRQTDKLL